MSRKEVYKRIDGERDYQNALGSNRTDGSDHTVGDYLTMLGTYYRKAQDAWTVNAGVEKSLHEIRKIAAIAVRCMEEHGAPKRETIRLMSPEELERSEKDKYNPPFHAISTKKEPVRKHAKT